MPLAKQVIPIPLLRGVDAGVDPKLLAGPLRIENGRFTRRGAVSKRTGTSLIDVVLTGTRLAEFGDAPVCYGAGVQARAGSAWTAANGYAGMCDVAARNVAVSSATLHYFVDVAELDSVYAVIYATRDPDGYPAYTYGLVVETFHATTHVRLARRVIATGWATSRPGKIVAITGQQRISYYYFDASDQLYYGTINTTTGAIAAPASVAGAVCHTTYRGFDCCLVTNNGAPNVVLVYTRATATNIGVRTLPLGVPSGGADATVTPASGGTNVNVACWAQSATTWVLASNQVAGGTQDNIRCEAFNLTPASVVSEALVGQWLRSAHVTDHIAGAATSSTNNAVYVGRHAAVTLICGVLAGTFYDSGGGVGAATTAASFARHVRLGAKPFVTSPADTHVLGVYHEAWGAAATTQSGLYWVNEIGDVIGKSLIGTVRQTATVSWLPSMQGGLGAATYLLVDDNTRDNRDLYGVKRLAVTRSPSRALGYVSTGRTLALANACPYEFDGNACVEQGFLAYPEVISGSAVAHTSGLPAGTFQYRAIYEWVDASGQVHRSAPTPTAKSVVVTSAPSKVELTLPTLGLTRKSSVQIAIYRTVANGVLMYRVGAIENTTADTVLYTDTCDDATLATHEQLYTTGQVENVQPPPYRVTALWDNRQFAVDAESGDLRYSKEFVPTEAICHSDLLTVDVDDDGGEITALAPLLDKLIVWKAGRTFITDGQGLDAAAKGMGYSRPWLLSPTIGCVDMRTVVRTDKGIAFKAADGIWIITNGLQLQPIGDRVRYWTDTLTIVRGVVIGDRNQAIWLSSDGTALCYDFARDEWTTYLNHACVDAVAVGDRMFRLRSNGKVFYDNRANFEDTETGAATNYVPLAVETGWISLAQLTGYQRVYRLLIVGQNIAGHTLRVKVAYDFNPLWIDNLTFDSSALQLFDVASYYGAGLGAAYDEQAYVLTVHPSRQKCTAIRVRVADELLGAYVEGWSLTGFGLVVGVKAAQFREATARNATGVT